MVSKEIVGTNTSDTKVVCGFEVSTTIVITLCIKGLKNILRQNTSIEMGTLADKMVVPIEQMHSYDPMSPQDTGKEVSQDLGDFISFKN